MKAYAKKTISALTALFTHKVIALSTMSALNASVSALTASMTMAVSGPYIEAIPLCWSKVDHTSFAGTAFITVDEIQQKTLTTTVFRNAVSIDGSSDIFTPTSTNSHGTSTTVIEGVTVTYPTRYTSLQQSLIWESSQPTKWAWATTTCCYPTTTAVATTVPGFVGLEANRVDPSDANGWHYTLQECMDDQNARASRTSISGTALSSLIGNQTLPTLSIGCPYVDCGLAPVAFADSAAVQAQALTTAENVKSILVMQPTTLSIQRLSVEAGLLLASAMSSDEVSKTSSSTATRVMAEPVIVPSIASSSSQVQSQQTLTLTSIAAVSTLMAAPSPFIPFTATVATPVLMIEPSSITASTSRYTIGDQPPGPDSSVILSGTTVRLASTPMEIVVDSSTAVLTTEDTGNNIWQGLGSTSVTSKSANSTASLAVYRGDAGRLVPGLLSLAVAIVAVML